MSLLGDAKTAWREGGISFIIRNAPWYAKLETKKSIGTLCLKHGVVDQEELKSHCGANNALWHYGDPHEFEIEPPLTTPPPAAMREIMGTHAVSPSFVCELRDVRLAGRRAITRVDDGRYVLEEMGTEWMLKSRIPESYRSLSLRQLGREIVNRPPPETAEPRFDVLINLVPRHGQQHNDYINYGHWLLEDLPRLRAYNHYREATGQEPRILLKNDPPSWATTTLRLLGFDSSDWVEWNERTAIVSRLVIPKLNYVHSSGWQYQPSDRRWVGEEMKSRVDMTGQETLPERIYVSRQGQKRRRVSNFEEVFDVIEPFGFEVVRPEEMSVEEQIRLFDQVDVILGPSGSAFANAIFADDATLVQLVPHGRDGPHGLEVPMWYILTGEQGLQYDHIIGKPTESDSGTWNKNADVQVPVDELERTIEHVI